MEAVLLYEGKAKRVFETDKPDEVIISFKDDATAFNGVKKDSFADKGKVNLAFTKHFFNLLQQAGIKTHIISFIDKTSLRAKKVQIVPLEVVVRNYAAGSLCKRLGFEKGMELKPVLCEFYLKDDSLNDPILCREHIKYLNIATEQEVAYIEQQALSINKVISSFMDSKGITLVDYKLEFGRTSDEEIILADEISPDTCRFWLKGTMESLDKDVYREDKGDLVSSYKRLAEILGLEIN
ncbi:MAG TPA: phosphoribosylaminoimidazolesuccinocarboxamide synthase [Candidatus Gastranaerophilales bacterium]|nr:phosphoribosylaminoimidazolesuccinocarboxamide synthase [Candidatus Gastranaerophilales bacterium]